MILTKRFLNTGGWKIRREVYYERERNARNKTKRRKEWGFAGDKRRIAGLTTTSEPYVKSKDEVFTNGRGGADGHERHC